jgi:hypothetical protein
MPRTAAQHLLRLRHQRLNLVLVGEVAGQHVHAVLELPRELVEHVAAGAGDRHGRTLLVKRARDRPTDPAGRSGDERGLAGQIEHSSVPWFWCVHGRERWSETVRSLPLQPPDQAVELSLRDAAGNCELDQPPC